MRAHWRMAGWLAAGFVVGCSEPGVTGGSDAGDQPVDLAVSDAPLMEVTLAPLSPTVELRGSVAFSATVSGVANQAVTWSLAGSGCSGAACGVLDASGHYRGPWCLPAPAEVTVTAASVADPSRTASTRVTLTRGAPEVVGRYAFQFTGTTGSGNVHVAGGFVVDAQGRVTEGVQDIVHADGVSSAATFTGSATSSCYRRGHLALDFGDSQIHTFAWAVDAAGDRFRFIELDATGQRGAGQARRVDAAALTTAAFAGDHVLTADGSLQSPTVRAALLGRFHADGQGTLSAGRLHENQGGAFSSAAITGHYALDNATGRGTATLTAASPLARTFHFAFYPYATSESFWVSSDAPGGSVAILGGRALRQGGGPWSAASLGGNLLMTLIGTAPGSENSSVTVGLVTAHDDGSVDGGPLDENDDTAIASRATLSGTVSLDPLADGGGALHLRYPGGGGRDLTMVLVAPGRALLLDGTALEAGTRVAIGELTARSGEPFSTAALQGDYVLGSDAVPTRYTPVECGVLQFDGVGGAAGMGDASNIFTNQADRVLLGGNISIPATGRLAAVDSVIWLASPTHAWSFSVSAQQHQPTLTAIER